MDCNRPAASDDLPLLSIVVLVYNTAEYLEECFDSLLEQQYRNIEVIAIDDASTDASLEICRAYEAKDARFRCVAKASNDGGAVVGNLGVGLARGEYVALVDSDDVVTAQGYARLMAEAVAASADIVIGRAARLTESGISAAAFLYEPFVWARRRTLESVHEFPELMHDGFYWNKVFRRTFLIEHHLGMVPGLLYADRPFVHKAYFHSRKTVVIPDLVYLWRSRPSGASLSITQNKSASANFLDRMRSVEIEWADFEGVAQADSYRRMIAVSNLQRALHVSHEIVASPSFRTVFVEGMQRLLRLYGDLDYRSLGVRRCLYLELLKRNEIGGLCYLLGLPTGGDLVELDGACYWKQPFLDNAELGIGREISRVDFPTIGFFNVSELTLADGQLRLGLSLHDAVMTRCSLSFELHSLYGERTLAFEAQGQIAPHLYGFSLPVAELSQSPVAESELLGLVLKYTCGQAQGYYRIGWSLLAAEVQSRLPLSVGSGLQLLYSVEAGGVAIRLC